MISRIALAFLLLIFFFVGGDARPLSAAGAAGINGPSGPLGLTLFFPSAGTTLTFDQNLAGADEQYVGQFVSQHSYRQDSPDGNWHIFFRPDAVGTRDEVVVEYGQLLANGQRARDYANPYVATIYKNGTPVTAIHVPWHGFWTRWRWCTGGVDGAVCPHRSIVRNVATLQKSKLVLPYDDSMMGAGHPVYPNNSPWTNPAPGPYPGPMNPSSISHAMGAAGERDDIGWVPEHQAAYIDDQSNVAATTTLWAWAEAAASIPWHYRDVGSGALDNSGAPLNAFSINNPNLQVDPTASGTTPLQMPSSVSFWESQSNGIKNNGVQQIICANIVGTTLTVNSVGYNFFGNLISGAYINAAEPSTASIPAGTQILSQLTNTNQGGRPGAEGTYQLNKSAIVSGSGSRCTGYSMFVSTGKAVITASINPSTLTIDTVDFGTLAVGDTINQSACGNTIASGGPTTFTLTGSRQCTSLGHTEAHAQMVVTSATKGGDPPIAAPSVSVAPDGRLPAGRFAVQIAYVDANGNESPASPVTIVSRSANQQFIVNAPPPRSGATGWVVLAEMCSDCNGFPPIHQFTSLPLSTTTWTEPSPGILTDYWLLDFQHDPMPDYVPYVLTDDPYYLEEIQFNANANILYNAEAGQFQPILGTVIGLFPHQNARLAAWGFRNFINTNVGTRLATTVPAYMLPASYWDSVLAANKKVLDMYMNPPLISGRGRPALILTTIPQSDGETLQIAPWMSNFMVYAVGFGVYNGLLSSWEPEFAQLVAPNNAFTNGTSGWNRQINSWYGLTWTTDQSGGGAVPFNTVATGAYDSVTQSLSSAFTQAITLGKFAGSPTVDGRGIPWPSPFDNSDNARPLPVSANYQFISWGAARLAAINGIAATRIILRNWLEAASAFLFSPSAPGCPGRAGRLDTWCNNTFLSYKYAIKRWP